MVMKKAIAKRPAHLSEQFQPKGRSELPRLSAALASYLDDSREEHQAEYGDDDDYDNPENGQAEEEFRGSHSIAGPYRNDKGSDIEDSVDESDAEEMLQNYRQRRDSGQNQPSQREDIRTAYQLYR
jgi:hypothetical protein